MSGQLFGYGSMPKAAPSQLPLLLPGVRNCVINLMDVKPGERFLVIAENTVDPVIIEAFESVASMAGADVTTMRCKPFSPAGIDPNNPSDVVVQAYAAADSVVILSWYPDIHSKKLNAHACKLYKNKACSLYQLATFDVLTSPAAQFPLPVMFAIMRKMRKMVAGKQLRITNELGTDLVLRSPTVDKIFGGIGTGLDEVGPMKPGIRAHFPPSTCGFVPMEANGVFVPNETIITGAPKNPIRITVEKNLITNIEGDDQAEALSAFIHGTEVGSGPKPLCECMWGLNPKARIGGANATMVEKERRSGALHLGIATYNYNPKAMWMSHVDCYLETPSIWLDGELIIDKRKLLLLEDPDIRAAAKEYGNPDEILRPGQPMDMITC